ncbi:cytoskeleton-associated protein 5-like isoform X2 [Haliotis rufescens]|uniref:cytoskeleton-associated protein 5-like isoform X2 n=1 Tax=Haliotis rufescens TaxID=6454 RepID=UPI00201F67EA|nr:cytoskeleton-associated protein 5-like isoform X2 [Haliotis rufescens]
MGDDSEWMKLPTEEKCTHKVWKARVAGYEEAGKLFQRIDDEKSPEFNKYAGLMKKFVTDSNAVAQEKALDAVLHFLENAHVAARTTADVVAGVVSKCLNASKTKTKEKGMEIIMMYIEIEKPDVVQEQLLAGLENKQPKIVVGCIQALTIALRDFGSKTIQIKPCLKVLPKLLEDRDKNVREETKQFIIELYRWIGGALKPQMSHFKPVQVQELEAEFERLPNEKPVQTRFMKSQQDLKAKIEEQQAAAASGEASGGDGAAETEEIDPFDLIEAVDILAKLPKDFFDQIEAKKWQERKEALDALQKLTDSPKIENGDFGNVIRALLKVIAKDTNVMLVALAGKCLSGIAKGLRKKFQPYAHQCVSGIIEKFKEKKVAVVTSLREAIDASFAGTSLDQIMEDCVTALENKNPSIRAETAQFLARCFAKSTVGTLPKKLLKGYCSSLLKSINDTTPDVREASFQALGTAMRVVSEKNIAPFLNDVDTLKMQKIQECCQNAVLLNARGEPRQGGGGAAAAPAPKKNEPKPVTRPPAKPTARAKPAAKGGPPGKKKVGGDKGKGKKGGAAKEEPTESILADEVVEEKAAAALSADVISGLSNSNWKLRLAAMETFSQNVKGMSKEEIQTQVFVRTLTKKPGLKDTNFQVLKLKLELIGYLGQNSAFTKTTAEFCLSDIVDKVGDVKNGSIAQEALSCIAEATSLQFVSSEVIRCAFEQKNPKNQSESMVWLTQAVRDFGFKVNIKPMIENIKKALAATNPAVRGAAIGLLGTVHLYMGPQLRMFFEDEKAALLQQIDAEFEKNKDQKPPAPTRGIVAVEEEDEEENGGDGGGGAAEEVNVQDLMPRNDISEKITEELLAELADKNWKVRAEALQKVIAILNEAKFIKSSIGELASALKTRLSDANKILVNNTIGICLSLATAMGPHCKHHIKNIGPGLISCMADGKPQVRAATVNALNAWVDQCTLTPLVESEAIFDGLKTENPNLRTELLNWLVEKLPTHRVLPTELRMCVPVVLACLEDRNADVRKKAQESLVPFMIHTGYDSFFKATSKLKPASKDQIVKIIEAARANLPAKAPKGKKASAPAAAPPPSASSRFDEPEEPAKQAKAEPKSKAVKGKGAKAPASSGKKKEEEETGPPITLMVPKEQRFKDEKNMKVLKWNFLEVRGEYVEQLRTQMEKNFSKSTMDQLFHNDFKFHIKAIQVFIKCLDTHTEETVGNLDLILKWITLRFYDTNPSMLNKALEFLDKLFSMLADSDYHLADIEAISFIPYLVLKVGESKDNVRREVRKIFKLICKVYPASKMFSHLIDGLKSKNSKQRAECLDELGSLIESYGITICQPSPAHALKIIAQQISDRDTSVRNAALNTVLTAHTILGDGLYKYIGHLAEKDQSLLEERIKRSAKTRPPPKQEERPKTAPLTQKTMSQPNIPRANSAMQKSSSSNSVKREFALDIDTEPTNSYDMPQLIQHDLDDIYEPVKLPKIKARPPSPSMKLLNSNDAAATIGFVISQITSPDITTCIQALVQVDEVLKDEERAEIMAGHVDQLLLTLSMQFKMVYSTHMGDEDTPKDDVVRLYRCLLGTLLAILQTQRLAKKAGKDILKDVVNSLITILLDSRLMELEEGPQVVRSVNVTVVKIVEKTDHTSITGALIRLLQDCVSSETCTSKFLDLIMKCLWKMIRMLPDIINDLNVDRILMDCHLFLRAFPSSSWKDKGSDLPLRTIKTILHSLARLKGHKILYHTGMIESSENSEVEAYLQKVLKNDVAATNAKNDELNDNREKTPKSSTKTKRFSKTTHDMLAEIFKKIGAKENTKEGLNDLYDFKRKYPDADLEPFLKKSSQFFQNYIERGLRGIEEERMGSSGESGIIPVLMSSTSSSSSGPSVGSGEEKEDPNYFRERLKMLRVKCGLDHNKEAGDPDPSNTDGIDLLGSTEEIDEATSLDDDKQQENIDPEPPQPTNPAVSVDVSDLKMRLERIKKLANKS